MARELADGKLRLDFPADHVARLTIDNPDKRNALDHDILDAFARTLPEIEALFKRLGPMQNTFTTNTHFSLYHLSVIEKVVLSVVSDDFTIGPTARRWLDEDEYLVRRRIHAEMKPYMAQLGL